MQNNTGVSHRHYFLTLFAILTNFNKILSFTRFKINYCILTLHYFSDFKFIQQVKNWDFFLLNIMKLMWRWTKHQTYLTTLRKHKTTVGPWATGVSEKKSCTSEIVHNQGFGYIQYNQDCPYIMNCLKWSYSSCVSVVDYIAFIHEIASSPSVT